jgi:hypothetical protein
MPGKSRPNSNDPGGTPRSAASRRGITSSDRLLRELVADGDVLPWDWDLEIDRFRWAASPAWLLGAPDALLAGGAIWQEFFTARDWPLAAAASMALLAALLPPLLLWQRLGRR